MAADHCVSALKKSDLQGVAKKAERLIHRYPHPTSEAKRM
jgi:hypothetical protein